MQRQPEGIPLINQMEYVEEVLSNLKPDTTYTFTITIENGVSDQDTRGKDLRSCKLILWKEVCSTKIVVYNAGLIFFLLHPGPSPPHGVQTFCSAVGWRVILNPNGKIIGYDVLLMGPGDGDTILLSIESDSTFSAIHNDYQKIGTTVQVRRYKNRHCVGKISDKLDLMITDSC